MPGQESTSVSDLIQGECETRENFLAVGRLYPGETLAVARRSAHGFRGVNRGSGVAQLALLLHMPGFLSCSAQALRGSGPHWLSTCSPVFPCVRG